MLVAHVSLNAFALRRVLDEEPEPDALHTPFDDKATADEHAGLYKGIVGRVGRVGQKKKGASKASALGSINRSLDQ